MSTIKTNSLGKNERLKSRKQIELIFKNGNSLLVHPLKIIWLINSPGSVSAENEVQIGVSVSKRNFKKATDRNRAKRLLREGYRLNKHDFITTIQTLEISVSIFFIYVDKSQPTFDLIQEKMKLSLTRLSKKMKNNHEKLL